MNISILFFAAAALLVPSLSVASGSIRIEKAASHSMVPGATVGDGYVTIVNDSAESDRLVFARSARANSVQLHRMTVANGVMTMRDVKDGLPIPPHATVTLEPDYHLMFNGVTEPFRQGERVPATLTFERAGDVAVSFVVGRIAGPLNTVGQQPGTTDMPGMDIKATDMKGMDMSAMSHQPQAEEDPAAAIQSVLKTMFETQDKPLDVGPVVSGKGWAVAGWRQDGRGGRVLLKHTEDGWQVHALGGDSLKSAPALETAGVPANAAGDLAQSLARAEAALEADAARLLGTFDGIVMLSEGPEGAGHADHGGH